MAGAGRLVAWPLWSGETRVSVPLMIGAYLSLRQLLVRHTDHSVMPCPSPPTRQCRQWPVPLTIAKRQKYRIRSMASPSFIDGCGPSLPADLNHSARDAFCPSFPCRCHQGRGVRNLLRRSAVRQDSPWRCAGETGPPGPEDSSSLHSFRMTRGWGIPIKYMSRTWHYLECIDGLAAIPSASRVA